MTITKNLIFDLGNVLYDIDFVKMYQAFDDLGIPDFENHFTLNKSDQIFFYLPERVILFHSIWLQLVNLNYLLQIQKHNS